MIKLGELTDFQTVKWKFPNTKNCPLDRCSSSFPNRNSALDHFCQDHANTSMECMHCKVIFPANDALVLFRHYQVEHEDEQPPKLKTTTVQPSAEYLAKYSILCDLCEEPILSNQTATFDHHFQQFHPNKLPFQFDRQSNLNLDKKREQRKSTQV